MFTNRVDDLADLAGTSNTEFSPMDPEVKAKLVAALRSGTYLQGKGALKARNDVNAPWKFCCLGVLVEVAGGTWDEWAGPYNMECGGSQGMPPEGFLASVGLAQRDKGHYLPGVLAQANDRGATFEEIADWIENRL